MICFDFQYAKAMYRAAAAGVIVSISGTLIRRAAIDNRNYLLLVVML